ncbi:hypothetical protein ACN4EG_11855 [Alkalinema pantanalense CENA528]|uniref:hypothetical protein n=1 Tax=Alkalinema pantanalense TaxID=1620705 RepID=UPI003D700D2B
MFDSIFNTLNKQQYQQGQHDRDAGLLPQSEHSSYLEGYLKGRPEGLDGIIQYFPTVDFYLKWKFNQVAPPFA